MPLGQLMLTLTSTTRSVPSSRDRSIRGYWPHSVQNKYLWDGGAQGLSPQNTEERALSVRAVDWPACPAPHPFSGWTVMARGLSRPWEMTT